MAAFGAQSLDVRAGCLGHAQPVQCEQRDQRMLGRGAEPCRDEQGADLVAVQAGGVGLVVQARQADVGGWGVVEQVLLDRVPVESGDGG